MSARHLPGLGCFHEIIQNSVGHRLVERPFITVTPEIKLEALELHAELIRNIADADRREIRLAGLRAKAGEFRTFEVDIVVPPRVRILENFELLGWLSRHGVNYTISEKWDRQNFTHSKTGF